MFAVMFLSGTVLLAQESDTSSETDDTIRVFLDQMRRYQEYIKLEVPFVNYVRDRQLAHVHVMMTYRETGSGGREYTVTFTGLKHCAALNDTLMYTSSQMDTEETVRSGIARVVKMGLMRYVGSYPVADDITISYRRNGREPDRVVDRWNYWVFNIDTDARLDGEESERSMRLRGSVSADRVTPDWKMSFHFGSDNDREEYDTETRTITSTTRSKDFRSLIVKSISDHWSAGMYFNAESSDFENIDASFGVSPAIELNVFPYDESTYHEFCFLYRIGYTDAQYQEKTIYDKMDERLFNESLSATYEVKENWGSIWTMLEGSHFLHDTTKNKLVLRTNFNIRVARGFSIDLFSSVSQIRDQLALPREDASEEDILLQRRELATDFDYFVSVGFRYTFGSIYSNVVNPRFTSHRSRYYR
jgi:hypothetical protein